MRTLRCLLVAVAAVRFGGVCLADPAPNAPEKVTIGVYLLDMSDLDTKRCTYAADFYIWLRWHGDVDPREFEIMNGHLDVRGKVHPDYKEIGGTKYVSYRCRALLHSNFDFANYPWDRQELSIEIEDADHDRNTLIYVADEEGTSCHPDLKLQDWQVGPLRCYVWDDAYDTGYGSPARRPGEKAVYSRFSVVLPIRHAGMAVYLKTFLVLFISVATAFLTFLIHPNHLEARFGVSVPGIFGAVTGYVLVAGRLPDAAGLSLADRVHYLGILFIFLSLLESCASVKLWFDKREKQALRLDRWTLAALVLSFCGLVALASYV
jgi:hypothetical protein